jgi:hypothetical protein
VVFVVGVVVVGGIMVVVAGVVVVQQQHPTTTPTTTTSPATTAQAPTHTSNTIRTNNNNKNPNNVNNNNNNINNNTNFNPFRSHVGSKVGVLNLLRHPSQTAGSPDTLRSPMASVRSEAFPQRNDRLRVLGEVNYKAGHPLNKTGQDETVLLMQYNSGGHSHIVRAIVDKVTTRGEPLEPKEPSAPPPARLCQGIKRKLVQR